MRLSDKTGFRLIIIVGLAVLTYLGFVPMAESIVRRENIGTILRCLPGFIWWLVGSWLMWRYSSDVLNERPARWEAFWNWVYRLAVLIALTTPLSLIALIALVALRASLEIILLAVLAFTFGGSLLAIRILDIYAARSLAKAAVPNQPTEEST